MIPGLFELPRHKSTKEERDGMHEKVSESALQIFNQLDYLEPHEQDCVLDMVRALFLCDRSRCNNLTMSSMATQFPQSSVSGGVLYPHQASKSPAWMKEALEEEDRES